MWALSYVCMLYPKLGFGKSFWKAPSRKSAIYQCPLKLSDRSKPAYCPFRMKNLTISDLKQFLRSMAFWKAVNQEITLGSFSETEVGYWGRETRNKPATLRWGGVKRVTSETVQWRSDAWKRYTIDLRQLVRITSNVYLLFIQYFSGGTHTRQSKTDLRRTSQSKIVSFSFLRKASSPESMLLCHRVIRTSF